MNLVKGKHKQTKTIDIRKPIIFKVPLSLGAKFIAWSAGCTISGDNDADARTPKNMVILLLSISDDIFSFNSKDYLTPSSFRSTFLMLFMTKSPHFTHCIKAAISPYF